METSKENMKKLFAEYSQLLSVGKISSRNWPAKGYEEVKKGPWLKLNVETSSRSNSYPSSSFRRRPGYGDKPTFLKKIKTRPNYEGRKYTNSKKTLRTGIRMKLPTTNFCARDEFLIRGGQKRETVARDFPSSRVTDKESPPTPYSWKKKNPRPKPTKFIWLCNNQTIYNLFLKIQHTYSNTPLTLETTIIKLKVPTNKFFFLKLKRNFLTSNVRNFSVIAWTEEK
jgi:hypothetical protein